MRKFYKYPTIISFAPALVFIPIIVNLVVNSHSGGIKIFCEFISSAFTPAFDKEILITALSRIIETFKTASISWLISLVFGIIIGTISSEIFNKILNFPFYITCSIRLIETVFRSIHELVWCLILMQIYGIDFSIAIIAICIPYSAVNAKVIREQLNNIDIRNIESIIQINGKTFSSLITIIWSPIKQTIYNFGIYRFECALRSTAVLGIFGIGGIGTNIYLSFQAFNFKELWTHLWGLALLIFLSKIIFNRTILKKIHPKISLIVLTLSVLVFVNSIYYLFIFLVDFTPFNFNSIITTGLSFSEIKLIPIEFFGLISETVFLSLLAICIAISLPPILMLIFNDDFGKLIIRGISFWLRIIPPPVLVLLFLVFNRPSISLAALTLGLYNAAITSKLLYENIENTGKNNYIALKSIGASKRISWLFGLFAKQSKSYLAYCSYRADIIIRETAIVSAVGGIGLGWQLKESLSSFAWSEVIIILFSYCSIATIGEMINGKIKSYLN